MKTIKISPSGSEMPIIGLGTARAPRESLGLAVRYAIKCGYRHFDCAWLFGNEDIIGNAIKEAMTHDASLKREDFFISSKVWYSYNTLDKMRRCLDDTLRELKVDYLDLYVLQWPISFKDVAGVEPDHPYTPSETEIDFIEMYKNMEVFLKEGKIKNIGVSNFSIEQLKDVLNYCDTKPVTNQIELHPYLQNDEMSEFCKKNDILVSCYGPIGAGEQSNFPDKPALLENSCLVSIGKKYNKTSAQVCLRWAIQKGYVVLPKSVHNERILENIQVFDFELSPDDMRSIHNINEKLSVYSFELYNEQAKKPLR